MPNLIPGTYPAFIAGYVNFIRADTVSEAIEKYSRSIKDFFKNIPLDKVDYRYAEDKWNIKEVLQHIIDAERIFAYRALSIARHDKTPLPGFDEKSYAIATNADQRSWENLLQEFEAVRKSTDLLLQSFTADQLQQSGTTNNQPNTVEALSFLVFGHILHHINVLKERYL
jgi:uncharacterized damage-inducible protein DinB